MKRRWFYANLKELEKQKGADTSFEFGNMRPILSEMNNEGGTMKGHYFHQDLFVARMVCLANPKKHLILDHGLMGLLRMSLLFERLN